MLIRLFVIVTSALLIATAIANAQDARPALRAEATVTGGLVRIGDLVENAGIVANVPVFRAPALGETGYVEVGAVLTALRAHALVGLDPGPISQISVTRASRPIASQEIEGLLIAALSKEHNLGDPKDIAISFDRSLRTLHIEPNVTEPVRIARLRYDPRSSRFDAAIEVGGIATAAPHLSGTAVATQEVVTLTRALARGEIVKADDLTTQRLPRARVGNDSITDRTQAIGMSARTAIASERPLRAADLMKPEVVQRGAYVTITYQVPGVVLAVRGKASEGGAEGDMIDVVNVQSNRALRATITGPGHVAVMSMTPRIVASAEAPVRNLPAAKQ